MIGTTKTRVVIVEDNEDINSTFTELINNTPEFEWVTSYNAAEKYLANLNKDKPDIVLMDIGLPGVSGIKAIKESKKILAKLEILVISVHNNNETVFEALCSGASGYITKIADNESIIKAIHEVIRGGAPMSTQIARMVVKSFNKNQQTPLIKRETEILEMLSTGKSHARIADELFLSKETIRTHMRNIYTKLEVNTKADAIALAKNEKYI
jgi:DNA-binding NarL/FixJ family response regulator